MLDIANLYTEKKCIIVGKSSYSYDNKINTAFLNDFVTIGLNSVCLQQRCDWTVVLDAWLYPKIVEQIRPHTEFLALQNLWIENLNISHLADVLFTVTSDYTPVFNNKLFSWRSVAIPAVHLAIFMGFKEILLFNVDFGPVYAPVFKAQKKIGCKSKDNEFSKRDSSIINSLIQDIATHYKVKVYQANPKAITPLPIVDYRDFCHA